MTKPTIKSRIAQLELRVIGSEEHMPEDARELGAVMKRWGLSASPQEAMWVVAYDAMLTVRTIIEIGRGGHNSVDLHLPSMLGAVITSGCERFVLVHNHPSNDLRPTVADFSLTRDVSQAADACGLYFEDHVIVGPNGGFYSFVDSGFLVPATYPQNQAAAQPTR